MARRTNSSHRDPARSRRAKSRAVEFLRDPAGWPSESAPLRVRTGVMSNLAAQRQRESGMDRVTLYRDSRSRRHPLQFSLRPPLAAAAVIAMIVSASIHFMGGVEAWQPWADGIANRYYDVPAQGYGYRGPLAGAPQQPLNDVGRTEAEALFSDVLRFRAHMSGRIPVAEPQSEPRENRRSTPASSPQRPSRDSEDVSS